MCMRNSYSSLFYQVNGESLKTKVSTILLVSKHPTLNVWYTEIPFLTSPNQKCPIQQPSSLNLQCYVSLQPSIKAGTEIRAEYDLKGVLITYEGTSCKH